MATDSNGIHFDVTANAQAAEKAFAELRAKAIRDLDAIGDESQRINAKINALSAREKLKLDLAPEFSGKSTESDLNKALARDAIRAFNQDIKRGEPDREKLLWQIDQLRIGAEQLGRGSFGGVPNLLKAWAAGSNESALAAGALSSRVLLLGAAAGAAVISIGLIAKGLVDAANSAATMADELQRLEDQTGLTADRLQYFQTVALVSNLELKDFTTALTSFRRAAQDARLGNEELASIFKILKQDVNDTSEKAFADLIRKTADLTDETVRSKVEQEVFGGSIRGVARALDEQSKLSDKAREDLQRVSQLQSGEALEAAREYSRNTKLLGLEFDNLVAKIGNAVIPTFNSWLATLREGRSLIDILADAMRDLPAVPGELGLSGEGRDTGTVVGQGTPNPFAGVTGFSTKFVGKGSDKDSSSGKLRSLFSGGSKRSKRKGKEDISDIEKEVGILRVREQEAQKLYNETAIAADKARKAGFEQEAQKLYNETAIAADKARKATLELIDAEERQAQVLLPNQRSVKQAELAQKRAEAEKKYSDELQEINEQLLKPMEDLSKRINEENLKAAELAKQIADEDERRAGFLREMLLDAQATQATVEQIKAGIFSASVMGSLRPRVSINKSANADIASEEAAHARRVAILEKQRDDIKKIQKDENADQAQAEALLKAHNANVEAEAARHKAVVEEIEASRQQALARVSPLQERFNELGIKLFGEQSQAAVDFSQIAGQAFDSFGQGLGQIVNQWVLLGATGPNAMRKLTASVLAGLSQQATVKALYYLAEGIAAATNPITAYMAPGYFHSAAVMGTVAAVAGVAGRAIAGNSFQQGGGSANGAGGAAQGVGATTINRGVRYGDNAQEPKVIILRAEYNKGIIVSEVTSDYKRNGSTRQTMRGDLSNENVSVV